MANNIGVSSENFQIKYLEFVVRIDYFQNEMKN